MKIISLVTFKNEESFLPSHIASVAPYVDEIIGLDHGSSDSSAAVFAEMVGTGPLDGSLSTRSWSRGGELDVRRVLLSEGRRRGGTHFLVLDADECLTPTAGRNLRFELSQLSPGDALQMPWIVCWNSTRAYRTGTSQWNMPLLDFAFHDTPDLDYQTTSLLHVSRTPSPSTQVHHALDTRLGGVIHYQFAFWQQTAIKQAWYRCIDFLNKENSPQGINRMYMASKTDPSAETQELPSVWIPPLEPSPPSSDWRLEQILEWFDIHGVRHFEPIDIWDVQLLRERFIDDVGRAPLPRYDSDLWYRVRRKIRKTLRIQETGTPAQRR